MGMWGAAARRVGTIGIRVALLAGLAMAASIGVASDGGGSHGSTASAAGPDPAMFPLNPQRFAETREGAPTFDGQFQGEGQRAAGSTYKVSIAGRGSVPVDADGVVIYLTAVDPTGWGYLTVSACEDGPPVASSVNYDTDITVGNEIVADLSPSGELCVFTFAATDLTIDVVGYVPAGNSIVTFRDRRLLDTREGAPTFDGQSEGIGRTAPGSNTTVQVTGRANIPAGTETVIVNVAALSPTENGFVAVHPCLPGQPSVSSLNYSPGVDRANELIAELDADGRICIFTQHDLDLIMDVVGYLPPGTNYVDITSRRYLETRSGATTFDGQNQGEGLRPAGSTYTLPVAGRGPVPDEALAVVANVVAVDPVSGGFLTVHPCLVSTPNSASLNYREGVNGANEIVARVDGDGEICLFTFAPTHLIVDVTGYLMADLTATTDSYDTFGNVLLEVGVAPTGAPAKQVAGSVLDNDIGDGALTVTAFDASSALGGTVDMNADGTFTYDPPPGSTGVTDTFEYTMTDGAGFDTATVRIDLTEMIWFVDNSAPAGGDGTSATPFDQLAAAGAASGPGDTIFVFVGDGTDSGYDQGIVLDANQNLVGEKAGLTVGGTVLVAPGGGRPTLSAAGGADVVTLGSDATIESFLLDITGAGAAISSSGAGGAVTDVDITANSEGIDLDGATGTFTFTDVDITSSGGIGLDVNGPANVNFVGGTITQSGNAPAVDISASTGTIQFDATSTITATNGTGLQFDDADGTYAFQGPVTLNGGEAGIDIVGDSAGTFTFGPQTNIVFDGQDSGLIAVDIDGFLDEFSGDFDFDGSIATTNNGEPISINETAAGSTIDFNTTGGNSITSVGNPGLGFASAGITMFFADGDVSITTPTTLTNADLFVTVGNSAGDISFADTTLVMSDPTTSPIPVSLDAVSGTVTFTDLDIDMVGAPGEASSAFFVSSSPAATVIVDGTSSISSSDSTAVDLRDVGAIDMTFAEIVTSGVDGGISVEDVPAGTFVVDQATIDQVTINPSINARPTSGSAVAITNSGATFTFASTDITDAERSAVHVNGATAPLDFTGSTILQGDNAPGVEILGGHTGTFTFDAAGSITATNGTGLRFDDADGVYDFPAPVILNGGDAGIDILNDSAGTFTFADVAITSPTGVGVRVDDLAATGDVDVTGPITSNGGQGLVDVNTTAAGSTIDFHQSGGSTLSSTVTGSSGIFISDADGDVTFDTPVTIDDPGFSAIFIGLGDGTFTFRDVVITNQSAPGNAGVDIINTSGTVNFTDLDIQADYTGTGFGGLAFLAQPGNVVNIFGADNDISSAGGPAIALSGGTTFDVTLDEVTSTGSTQVGPVGQDGVVIFDAGAGTFTVTGTTTIDGPGDQGIDIDDVSGTITFADVAISNTGDAGISTGAVTGAPAAVTINGGTFDTIGDDALEAGLSGIPGSGGNLTVNNVIFTNVTAFTADFFNSTLGGSGNTAVPFSCSDDGGNTGFITFNAGADTCP